MNRLGPILREFRRRTPLPDDVSEGHTQRVQLGPGRTLEERGQGGLRSCQLRERKDRLREFREHIRLAALLAACVDTSPGSERLAPSPFSLVCLCYRPAGAAESKANAASERLLDAVNRTGEYFFSHAKLDGRDAFRVAIWNIRTTESDLQRLRHLLQALAHASPRSHVRGWVKIRLWWLAQGVQFLRERGCKGT